MKRLCILLAALLLPAAAAIARQPHARTFAYQGELSLRGQLSDPSIGCGFSYISGLRINPYLFVGGGVGLSYYRNHYSLYIPLSLEAKGYFPINRTTDFLFFCGGGVMFDYKHPISHGFIRPGFGLNFRIAKSFAINLGIYYEYAPYDHYTYTEGEVTDGQTVTVAFHHLHSAGVAIGFSF